MTGRHGEALRQALEVIEQLGADLESISYRLRSGLRGEIILPVCACAPDPPVSAPADPSMGPARHSVDFRSVHWFGADYTFTSLQAAIVRQLWEAWEKGVPAVGGDTLLVTAGAETREMRALFRGHSAWGSMIASAGRGAYRLAAREMPG